MTRPVMIDRDLLLDRGHNTVPAAIDAAVRLTQTGWGLVLLSTRPQRWRPTRRSMDSVLGAQRTVHQALTRAGGELDAALYLDFGLFTRQRQRSDDLADLADRFSTGIDRLWLISTHARQLETVLAAGGQGIAVNVENPPNGARRVADFREAVDKLLEGN